MISSKNYNRLNKDHELGLEDVSAESDAAQAFYLLFNAMLERNKELEERIKNIESILVI